MTAGWDAADLATLTTLFGRFLDDIVRDPARRPRRLAPDGTTPTDLPREI